MATPATAAPDLRHLRQLAVPRDLVERIGEQKMRKLMAAWAKALRELAEAGQRGTVMPYTDWDADKLGYCGVKVSRREYV